MNTKPATDRQMPKELEVQCNPHDTSRIVLATRVVVKPVDQGYRQNVVHEAPKS
jgi:hypothetical protein